MRNKPKAAAFLTACGLFLAGLSILPVSADNGVSKDGKWYLREYPDDVISVSIQDKTVTEVEIPSVIDGKTITMVEVDGFKDCVNLKSIKIPDTVTVIEDYAFYQCSSLEEVNIPQSVKNIGFQAFYGCASLKEMKIPAATDNIEAFAFEGCSSLPAVEISEQNPAYKSENGIFFDKEGKILYLYPSAMQGTSYTVPEGCEEIYDRAFIGNPYLEHVEMRGISKLGEDAFYYCTSLKAATVPEGIDVLKGSVFGNCTSLQNVYLPSSLTEIGDSCFYNCLGLSVCEVPESVRKIGKYAFFNCPGLTRIRLTKNTETIGDYSLGWYMGEDQKPKRLPDFTVDAEDNTAAFVYCAENSIRCTGGVTQSTVFLYIILGVVALVIILTIVIIVVQKKIQKRYELN